MKRNVKKVEKRTFQLKNAFPAFVSLVTRGANLTPLAELRYDDNAQFSAVDINRIEFSKAKYSKADVEKYLTENEYSEFSIEEDTESFVVPGVDQEKFSEVNVIEYSDGLRLYVGKLIVPTESEQANNDVIDAEAQGFSEPEVAEVTDEVTTEETVAASEDEADKEDEVTEEVTNEETDTTEQVSASEENSEVTEEEKEVTFSIDSVALGLKTNEFIEKFNQLRDQYVADIAALVTPVTTVEPELVQESEETEDKTEITMTKDELKALFAEWKAEEEANTENNIDETEIKVQNSQRVQTDENLEERKVDEKADKFNQRKKSDLFGLRG